MLVGSVGRYSLDPAAAGGGWSLEVSDRSGAPPVLLAAGADNVENGELGTWSDADPARGYRLRTFLTDGLGRTLIGSVVVRGSGSRVRWSP